MPEGVGRFSKKIDVALPGSHTREIYEEWSWREHSTLAQQLESRTIGRGERVREELG